MPHIGPVVFGEVLFDCFPDGTEVLGGAPFNVAWHLQAFGLSPLLVSRVGDDKRGLEIIRAMTRWGMNTDCIQIDSKRPTGSVHVGLTDGEPTFDISPEDAYGHILDEGKVCSEGVPLIYHGSLALWHPSARSTLETVKQRCRAPVFIDVNLRPPWWDRDTVLSLVKGASWVKLNEDELQSLIPLHTDLEQKALVMLEFFHLQTLILTRGSRGATVYLPNKDKLHIEPLSKTEVVDTVGAGDSFSAVVVLGVIREWPMEKIIGRAQEFASAIVGMRGAVTTDRNFYSGFLTKWAEG